MKHKKNQVDFTVGDKIVNNQQTRKKFARFSKNSFGKEKAAKLLIALGAEQAALILKELEEEEIQVLVQEMLKIRRITEKEKKEILQEFYENINSGDIFSSGKEEVQKILSQAFSAEKVKKMIRQAEGDDLQKEVQFLENYDPKIITSILGKEHPQVIAAILSLMKPSFSANIIKLLPPEIRVETIYRIAYTSHVLPEGIEKVIHILKNRLKKKTDELHSELGGLETVVSILNHLDRKYENTILEFLEEIDSELVEKIKSRLYTFEELEKLDFEELRILLSTIDAKVIATALLGMPEEFKRTFFNALSQNKASDVLFEIDVMKNVPVKHIQEARNYILNEAKKLDKEGKIVIKKDKEDFFQI